MSTTEDGTDQPTFLESLLAEAVGPFFVELEDAPDLVIGIPAAVDIAELDEATSVFDQLDLLVDDETGDRIFDLFEGRPIGELTELVDDIREHFGILISPAVGWAALVDELDRYGEAMERDLIDLRLDLYDWVRRHRDLPWDKLLRIFAKPPSGGWYIAALGEDIDRATELLDLEEGGKLSKRSSTPSLVGWDDQLERLTEMVETLRRIEHAVWGSSPKFKGKGGKPPKDLPRPRTGHDRAKELRAFQKHDEMASKALGSRYKPMFSTNRER